MNDMLGTPIVVGSVLLWPGGNARYGGLKQIVGLVTKLTETRASCTWTELEGSKTIKKSSKMGKKVVVTTDKAILESKAVEALNAYAV